MVLEGPRPKKLPLLASEMVLEGPPRWPGVAIETPTQEAEASRGVSIVIVLIGAMVSMATPLLIVLPYNLN